MIVCPLFRGHSLMLHGCHTCHVTTVTEQSWVVKGLISPLWVPCSIPSCIISRAYKEKRACNTNISCENTENWVVTKNSSFRYQLSPDKYGGKRNLTTRHNGCLNKTLNSTKAERHIVERSIKDRYSFSAMWYCLSLVAEISETAERRRVLRAKLYRDSATETGNICCYSLHKWRLAILSIASWPSSRRIKL